MYEVKSRTNRTPGITPQGLEIESSLFHIIFSYVHCRSRETDNSAIAPFIQLGWMVFYNESSLPPPAFLIGSWVAIK